jgi:hypothetical protein
MIVFYKFLNKFGLHIYPLAGAKNRIGTSMRASTTLWSWYGVWVIKEKVIHSSGDGALACAQAA